MGEEYARSEVAHLFRCFDLFYPKGVIKVHENLSPTICKLDPSRHAGLLGAKHGLRYGLYQGGVNWREFQKGTRPGGSHCDISVGKCIGAMAASE